MQGCGTGVPGVGVGVVGTGVGVPEATVLEGTGDGIVDTGVPVGKVPEIGVEGVVPPVVLPGTVADGESTISCTISVCERISVSRSTHVLYVPGRRLLTSKES